MGIEPFEGEHIINDFVRAGINRDLEEETLTSLESKVDVYLSKIKELDSSLHQNEQKYQIIDKQLKSFVSVEKLHKSTPSNRHIFFAGIPLSHSLQLLSTLKSEQLSRERLDKLQSEVKKLSEEIDSLNEQKRVDFYRFECSVRKAICVGMGVSKLVCLFENYEKNCKRGFITALRNVNYDFITLRVRKLDTYKTFRFAEVVSSILGKRINFVLKQMRQTAVRPISKPTPPKTILNPGINGKYVGATITHVEPMVHSTDELPNGDDYIERGLLARLERLLEEEMKMLT